PDRGVGEDESQAFAARRARDRGARTARRVRDVPRAAVARHVSVWRADRRRADARFLSLVVREHVDAGPVRVEADARLLLPHRRRSVVAAGSPGRAPARLQLPDALVDLDPRGVSRALPALPAPAARGVEGAQ